MPAKQLPDQPLPGRLFHRSSVYADEVRKASALFGDAIQLRRGADEEAPSRDGDARARVAVALVSHRGRVQHLESFARFHHVNVAALQHCSGGSIISHHTARTKLSALLLESAARPSLGDRYSRLDSQPLQFYDSGKTMKRFFLHLPCLLPLLFLANQNAGAAEPARPLTIVLISGEYEYESAKTLPAFKQSLETNYGFNCIYLERAKGEDIPGLDALDHADLVILFVRRMTLPTAQLERFKKFLDSGRPMIGLRTASHAFENWKEFDREVLGGNYHNHYGNDLVATIKVRAEAAHHPVLKGIENEFVAGGSLYLNEPLPASSTVLLTGSVTNHPPEPVAWTHSYKSARVFYTSLGHPKDFENPSFRRLIVNAIFWTLNRPEAEAAAQKRQVRTTP